MTRKSVCWITGASSGIGAAIANNMATKNYRLILSARNVAKLDEVAQQCIAAGAASEDIKVLPLDVTDMPAMDSVVTEANAMFGQIDLLINNAGVSQRSLCVDTEMATYRRLFEVDVFGQIALTQAVLPLMLQQGHGHIAVTASVAGKIGVDQRTGYCAAKHAMMGFFDALRAEVTQKNISVSTIVPGYINTDIAKNALRGDGSTFARTDKDVANGMPADKAAEVIVRGLEKRKIEINVGEGIEMFGLYLKRFFPSILFKMVANRAKQY